MSLKPGSDIHEVNGSTYRLAEEIGRGGEGSVWSLYGEQSVVAKFYHSAISSERISKLEAMSRLKTDRLNDIAAWPLGLLKESKAAPAQGLLMRRVTGYASVNQLYAIKNRLRVFPEAQFPFLLQSAINTARAFATIHDAGQVIGDVNHSNLMVSQKATVALIDCDSFQVSERGKTFLCPVATPEFTPAELQGVSVAGKIRTAQHDSFGLSVLIFYLLFLGRHPFMGVYDSRADEILTLDRAIGEYRFPYALDSSSAEVRLPAFVPRLADFPLAIGHLFKRAFTRDAMSLTRPSATEWVTALGELVSAVKKCTVNSSHQYYSGLTLCPWCRFEGSIGTPIFGIRLTRVAEDRFNLTVAWAQIEAITPTAEALEVKAVDKLQTLYLPASDIDNIRVRRRRLRAASILLVSISSVVAVAELQAVFAILVILAALVFGRLMWRRAAEVAQPMLDSFHTADSAYKAIAIQLEQLSQIPNSFQEEKRKLQGIRAEYETLAGAKSKRLADLEATRRAKQLQHHLERFRIEDERIPMIGAKTTMMLLNAGVLDAWDINASAITSIKGFGPAKRDVLLAWRQEKERSFQFNPNQPVDPRDLHALEHEFQQKATVLKSKLNSGPELLRQSVSVWRAQRRVMIAKLNGAAEELAQATVNRDALRGF